MVVAVIGGAIVGALAGMLSMYLLMALDCAVEPVDCGWSAFCFVPRVFPVGLLVGSIVGYRSLNRYRGQ